MRPKLILNGKNIDIVPGSFKFRECKGESSIKIVLTKEATQDLMNGEIIELPISHESLKENIILSLEMSDK